MKPHAPAACDVLRSFTNASRTGMARRRPSDPRHRIRYARRATKPPIFRRTGRRVKKVATGLRTGRAAAPATSRPDRPSLTPGSRRLRDCMGIWGDATFFGGRGTTGALTRPARKESAASARQKYARTRPHGPNLRVFGTSSSGGTASSSSSSSSTTGVDTWWCDRWPAGRAFCVAGSRRGARSSKA